MRILSIESSCDETGASVVERENDQINVLSNVLATSSEMHATTGGIIPENAAREQVKSIIPVIVQALLESRKNKSEGFKNDFRTSRKILEEDIDAIAVTYGPGLIGSLLIGVETAKTLSYIFEKPIIPVNHLLAHIYANFISDEKLNPKRYSLIPKPFPFIGLIVSGGHTDLLYFKSHNDFKWLGGTRDDAAGEALDKIGRMLNLPYPAGPEIERKAKLVVKPSIKFQSPMIGSSDFDFSFSGLKAEVMRFVKDKKLNDKEINEVCCAVQTAVFDVLIKKTLNAAEKYNCKTILLGGGVSANQTLINEFKLKAKSHKLKAEVFSPEKTYCTDNAAMIGAYALLAGKLEDWKNIKSNPELYFA
jgi:N6-L-threonylcarbamoyladenine synthase